MAKQLNCRVVFTPEISVDVAVKMLSNLSLGRGSHLSLDVVRISFLFYSFRYEFIIY